MPQIIACDMNNITLLKEYMNLVIGTVKFNIARHSQIDGQSEVTNTMMETYVRSFVSYKPHSWVKHLALCE